MPCSSEHMEPTPAERKIQAMARHLAFVLRRLGREVPEAVTKQAESNYANDRGIEPMLCALLGSLEAPEIDAIVYDAKSAESRRLADWWEAHQQRDAERAASEATARAAPATGVGVVHVAGPPAVVTWQRERQLQRVVQRCVACGVVLYDIVSRAGQHYHTTVDPGTVLRAVDGACRVEFDQWPDGIALSELTDGCVSGMQSIPS